uniref:Uncharacterized protein n=1 Tax=Panagrolaimus sp. JU765 TaxID=591449 RepID=A0AC34Q6K1_9BILA
MFRNFIYIRYATSRLVVPRTVFSNGLNRKFVSANSQIVSFSSAATAEKDVNQKDKFGSLIDDVINFSQNKPNVDHSFAKKMDVESVKELEKLFEEMKPTSSKQIVVILRKLERFAMIDKANVEVFLKSEAFVSSTFSHVLGEKTDLTTLFEALMIIMKLNASFPVEQVEKDAPLSLIPSFDSVYMSLFKKVDELCSNAKLPVDSEAVIGFYCTFKNLGGHEHPAMKSFVKNIESLVKQKILELNNRGIIIALFNSLNTDDYQQLDLINPILSKIEELAPVMLLGELITIISTCADNSFRPFALLDVVSEAIKNSTEILTPNQLVKLTSAIRRLSFYHPRLVTRINSDFVNSINRFSKFPEITGILNYFTKGRMTDETAWKAICKWIVQHHKQASISDLRFCINAFAAENVDPKLIKPVASHLKSLQLQPGPNESPKKWLNTVWSLAILHELSPGLADSILKKTFQQALFQEISNVDEKCFYAQKLLQVNAAAKYDLKDYKGTLLHNVEDFIDIKPEIMQKLKYGKATTQFENYAKDVANLLPPGSVTPLIFRNDIGIFIDILVAYDTKIGKFVPMKSIEKNPEKPLNGLTAVIFFGDNHFTRRYSDADDGKRRLGGQYLMNIRHLKSTGARICVIPVDEIKKCADKVSRITFVKEQIANAKNHPFSPPSW